MKKVICVLLSVVLLCVLFVACGKNEDVANAPLEVSGDEGLVGTWTVDIAEYKQSSDPFVSSLSKLLYSYFENASVIEFKADGKAELAGKELEYKLEDKKLTLTWADSQSFAFDISGNDDKIELSYQGILNLKLKKK